MPPQVGVGSDYTRRFKAPVPSAHARQKPLLQRRDALRKGRKSSTDLESQRVDMRLIHSPQHKAVAPYVPRSDAEELNVRFLINYCAYIYSLRKVLLETDSADVTLVAAKTVTCVGPRFEWYPLAVRDEAFFHAVMSSTSSHAAYRQGVDLPKNFFFHRGEAIRLLNDKIASGIHDEATINTCAIFVQQEVREPSVDYVLSNQTHQSWEGRSQGAQTHLKGFLQIVRDAGGLHSPHLTAKTRRHIYL